MSSVPGLFYKEAMEQCFSFNSRLMLERKVRLPYLDSQTGVAQNSCNLLFERWQRSPGLEENQIYSYPNRRWKKKPRSTLLDVPYPHPSVCKVIKNPVANTENHLSHAMFNENSNGSSTQLTEHDAADLNNSVAVDFVDDDDDYYDDDSRKRRGRKTRGRGRGMRRFDREEERDRPYQCSFCDKKYKNKPGLNYHVQRCHQDELDADEEYHPKVPASGGIADLDASFAMSSKLSGTTSRPGSITGSVMEDEFEDDERQTRGSRRRKEAVTSAYCDFCLGDADENKKTGGPEELVSCADCGRSGHPTCLQFTDIMTKNVKKYKWQCIECKSCHLCGTSDNDDQLLFCDDCDRGYHMYCLTPPMAEPPEGSWICSLCELDKKEREEGK